MEGEMRTLARNIILQLFSAVLVLMLGRNALADIKDRTIKFGYGITEDHPLGQAVNKFAQLVEERSGGKIKARKYPSNQLGSEPAMVSATQGGVQEMVGTSTAPIVPLLKEFAVFDLPFLFTNEKEADGVLDGPVGKSLLEKLNAKGLIGLCYWETGFRNVTNSRRPVTKADDIKGLKLRTMQNPVYIDAFNTLGAHAVPLPFPELHTALETKVIDAQENPIAIIEAAKFNEVQKYLTITKHAYSPFVVIVGKRFWDRLHADEQKILSEGCIEARDYQRKLSRERNAEILAQLKAKGMIVHEIAPEEVTKMRQALQPVIDKYTRDVGSDLVSQTYTELDRIRKE
jgi:TRAP-type transport system periplasmic protein